MQHDVILVEKGAKIDPIPNIFVGNCVFTCYWSSINASEHELRVKQTTSMLDLSSAHKIVGAEAPYTPRKALARAQRAFMQAWPRVARRLCGPVVSGSFIK